MDDQLLLRGNDSADGVVSRQRDAAMIDFEDWMGR